MENNITIYGKNLPDRSIFHLNPKDIFSIENVIVINNTNNIIHCQVYHVGFIYAYGRLKISVKKKQNCVTWCINSFFDTGDCFILGNNIDIY